MFDNKTLLDAIKELQIIDEASLDEAFSESENLKKPFEEVLLNKNLISEEDLAKFLSELQAVPYIDLSEVDIKREILFLIPEIVAKQQKIIAFKKDEKGLHVAMSDPANKAIIDFLEKKIGIPLIIYITTKRAIENKFSLYLKDIGKAFEDVISESVAKASGKKTDSVDPPIIKIVDTILSYAYENNASDVHLEPEETHSLVRFRIDGILHDIIQFSLEIYPQIVTRVKVMANLRTDERQIPQDGKITFKTENELLDVRVSTVPVKRGEKVVMRLLSEKSRQISLQSLGLSNADLVKVTNAYKKPFGMILASGPTGSGKTTTMYAILKLLNNRDINIMTIEDPIEYDLDGVNQMQVNTKADLTFATGLRSILRQDPNVILVGEIRDEETADIAVNAAMTGHLVLSTLHTNDAATAIPRLLEMNIEPFLVSSTLNVVVAQRLVRKIHLVCRVSEEINFDKYTQFIDKETLEKIFGTTQSTRVYRGKGCDLCHNSGYEGRIGIYEVMEILDNVKQAIVEKKDASTIGNIARQNGMRTMLEDGLDKVKTGDTTIEEVLRVTKA